ncbi:MAG: riboflavin kinase / FMN adenylyltransferase [Verrucomicrobia bacterium]|jgi:riboflavin kinase/FMN adenylyltransferase|nr:MAG: riboflavin kinase / FMN adenylyltransferase [Verrucomicrobiota bacterium]
MTTIHRLQDLARFPAPHHLAIGVFDGLHLGHQSVWAQAALHARESGGTAILVSFDPHPRSVLSPGNCPPILTHTNHKLRIASRLGIDAILVVPFDREFASRPGDSFVADLHRHSPDLAEICVGRDWQFGHNRSGNFARLEELGRQHGFVATGLEPLIIDGAPVSSTRIRELIGCGDLQGAKRLLGRDYSVLGTVVTGNQLGRTIGFPTANLAVENEQLPPEGVYAVMAALQEGKSLPGVANLGRRPTVSGSGESRLEVHLLDYPAADFYGEIMEVWFFRHLRREQKFEGLAELQAQIQRDVLEARRALRS